MSKKTKSIGSKRINNVAPSATIATAKKVRELRAEGKDVISLSLGEPDFLTPLHIKNAGVEAIRANFTNYPPVAGIPELREATARMFREQHQLEYSPEQVLVSTGAKQSLYNLMMCLLDPGDEVIVPAPYWVSYLSMIELAGGKAKIVKTGTDQGYKISPEQLEKAITDKTRIFLLNSPGNPSGMIYTQKEQQALAEVLKAHPEVWVISDEIYSLLTFDEPHFSFARLEGMYDRTITVNGVSKAFAMTGWRIGVMAGPQELINLCERFQGQVTSGANAMAQKAAAEALGQNLSTVFRMCQEYQRRRDLLLELFGKELPKFVIPKPEGAFYLYPDVSFYLGKKTPAGKALKTAEDFALYLIEEAQVATVSGEAFGTDKHIRISYATSTELLKEAVNRMKAAVDKLK